LCLCTTAYAAIAYHHWCEYEPRSGRCVQHYVIKIIQKITLIENFTNPNSWTMTQKKMKCIDFNYE
jgi:hypothetical protein